MFNLKQKKKGFTTVEILVAVGLGLARDDVLCH